MIVSHQAQLVMQMHSTWQQMCNTTTVPAATRPSKSQLATTYTPAIPLHRVSLTCTIQVLSWCCMRTDYNQPQLPIALDINAQPLGAQHGLALQSLKVHACPIPYK